MLKFLIFDNLFSQNCKSFTSLYETPKYFQWEVDSEKMQQLVEENVVNLPDTVVFFSEGYAKYASKVVCRKKILLLLEPSELHTGVYEEIREISETFDFIFTHHRNFLDNKKFYYFPFGGCWVEEKDRKIWNKEKIVSAIFSSKNSTEGHSLRHKIFERFSSHVDFYGEICDNRIPKKIDGLKSYMFSIVVENTKEEGYFSEKLVDCFTTGTIPIFWGCTYVDKIFNSSGILRFNSLPQLKKILESLSRDLYFEKLSAVEENFVTSLNYLVAEDNIWRLYKEKLC